MGRQGSQVGRALRAADAHDAGPIGAQTEPQGWSLGRAAHHVFAAPQDADRLAGFVRVFPCACRRWAALLPAKSASVAERRGRGAAGPAPAGVGLDVGRLDPGGLQRDRPVARRHLDRVRQGDRAVAALDASGGRPSGPDPRGQWCVGTELDERAGRPRVVGEPSAAQDDVGPRALHGPPLDLRSPCRAQRVARFQVRRAGRVAESQRGGRGLHDGLPSGATAQVGAERPLDVPACRERPGIASAEGGEPHDDARRAEAALARPGCHEGRRPAVADRRRCTLERDDGAAGDATDRCDAGNAREPVDPDGAASALSLRTAAVLDGRAAELLAQRIEEGDPVDDGYLGPVQAEANVRGRGRFGRRVSAAGPTGSGAGIAQEGECPVRPRLS